MKIRLDQYLVQNGLVQSRERAKALIMAGVVFVNQQKVDKAGEMIKEDAVVEVRGHDIGYVSRGGLKLEKAMKCFPLAPNGKVCMDIGASTGGFTDCMSRRRILQSPSSFSVWMFPLFLCITSSRWHSASPPRTPWASVW